MKRAFSLLLLPPMKLLCCIECTKNAIKYYCIAIILNSIEAFNKQKYSNATSSTSELNIKYD